MRLPPVVFLQATDGTHQVRATALVHTNHRDGCLPPEIDPRDLAGTARKPNLTELRDMFALHHLVRCVEVRYCHVTLPDYYAGEHDGYGRWPFDRIPSPPTSTPEEPQSMHAWRDRFHAAAYTTFLMGAVFCRAYQQPFYPGTTSSLDDEAEESRRELLELMRKASIGRAWPPYLGVEEEERDYLRRFPAFDLNYELGAQTHIFGPFIEWFIQSTLLQYRTGPPPSSRDLLRDDVKAITVFGDPAEVVTPPGPYLDWPESGLFTQWFTGGSAAEGEAILWLAMQSIHMFEFILTCIVNADGKQGFGRVGSRKDIAFSGRTRTAKVVLFGVFQAESIQMPGVISGSSDPQLLARPAQPHNLEMPLQRDEYLKASSPILDIPLVLVDLYMRSGLANQNNGKNTPPPPLQFFTFILKHHFNLQFQERLFQTYIHDVSRYHFFKNRATIFANGPELVPDREWSDYTNGSEFYSEYKPPLLTWRDMGMYGQANPRTWDLHDSWSHY